MRYRQPGQADQLASGARNSRANIPSLAGPDAKARKSSAQEAESLLSPALKARSANGQPMQIIPSCPDFAIMLDQLPTAPIGEFCAQPHV